MEEIKLDTNSKKIVCTFIAALVIFQSKNQLFSSCCHWVSLVKTVCECVHAVKYLIETMNLMVTYVAI